MAAFSLVKQYRKLHNPESNHYVPVSHAQKDIISGGLDLIN